MSDGWTIALYWGKKSGGWHIRSRYTTQIGMGRLAVKFIPRDLDNFLVDLLMADPRMDKPFDENLRAARGACVRTEKEARP